MDIEEKNNDILNRRELLHHAGEVSRKEMESKVSGEYKKFKSNIKAEERKQALKDLEEDLEKVGRLAKE